MNLSIKPDSYEDKSRFIWKSMLQKMRTNKMLKKHFGFRERKHDFSAISTLDGLHQQFIFILIRFKFIYPTDEKAFFLKNHCFSISKQTLLCALLSAKKKVETFIDFRWSIQWKSINSGEVHELFEKSSLCHFSNIEYMCIEHEPIWMLFEPTHKQVFRLVCWYTPVAFGWVLFFPCKHNFAFWRFHGIFCIY